MLEQTFAPSSRTVPAVGAVVGLAGFAASLLAFYERYWRWRECFNELGRCYDPDGSGSVYTTAGQVWVVVAGPFLLLAILSGVILMRRSSRGGVGPSGLRD